MRCEWDERKNRIDRRKHGISFEWAATALDDPFAVTAQDYQDETGEIRYLSIGASRGALRLLLVAHVYRTGSGEQIIRIISARKVTKYEEQIYWAHRGPH